MTCQEIYNWRRLPGVGHHSLLRTPPQQISIGMGHHTALSKWHDSEHTPAFQLVSACQVILLVVILVSTNGVSDHFCLVVLVIHKTWHIAGIDFILDVTIHVSYTVVETSKYFLYVLSVHESLHMPNPQEHRVHIQKVKTVGSFVITCYELQIRR